MPTWHLLCTWHARTCAAPCPYPQPEHPPKSTIAIHLISTMMQTRLCFCDQHSPVQIMKKRSMAMVEAHEASAGCRGADQPIKHVINAPSDQKVDGTTGDPGPVASRFTLARLDDASSRELPRFFPTRLPCIEAWASRKIPIGSRRRGATITK